MTRYSSFNLSLTMIACLTAIMSSSAQADWPQFRGKNSSGITKGPNPPVEFGPGNNELWNVSVQPGHSSPCIVGDAIYLTTFNETQKELALVCLDKSTGKLRWNRKIAVDTLEKGHPSFNPASSTPAANDNYVVAYFGSFGLICFDHQGNKQWDLKMPLTKSFGGNATSPVVVGDRVILYRGNYVDHFLLAVDLKSGKELWKVPQYEPITGEMACTACPIVAGDKLIVHTARSVQAIDLASGKQIWIMKCATTATSTPVIAGNEVIVAAWNKLGEPALRPSFPEFETLIAENDKDGNQFISRDELPEIWIFHRPDGAEAPLNGAKIRFDRSDKNKDQRISEEEWTTQIRNIEKYRSSYQTHGILAIPLNSQGIISAGQVRTLETQSIPEVPSPLCDGEYIYCVKNGGVLTCLNLKTGEKVYRTRTPGRGTHYASPILSKDYLYTTSGNGQVTVIKRGPNPEILATNQLPEEIYATPAIVDGVLYVRTHSSLFAFKK